MNSLGSPLRIRETSEPNSCIPSRAFRELVERGSPRQLHQFVIARSSAGGFLYSLTRISNMIVKQVRGVTLYIERCNKNINIQIQLG